MGIEVLGSIGSAISGACLSVGKMESIASGIGKAGTGAAPALSGFGEAMKAPLGNIISEGPVRGGLLKGFRPMNISDITTIHTGGTVAPLGEILFKPLNEPAVIQQAEAVAAIAWRASELPTPAQPVLQAESIQGIAVAEVVNPAEVIMPLVVPNIVEFPKFQPQIQTKTENRVSTAPVQTPAVLPQPAPVEQEVEEIVEEKVKKQKPEERREEDTETDSQMYLEDENASAQRRIEVKAAVTKASVEADRLGLKKLAGWLVARFLPGEHEGNRSQVVKKTGPDGSYQETVEAIAGVGDFESERKAVEKFDEIVADKKPVKYGKEGAPVANNDVARVFKYRIFRPAPVHEIVIKRVKRQRMQVVPGRETEIKAEKSLEELDPILAGVFQKAA